MLPHYSALKVAETFRMLEALHPGRIDLGLGRAPGSDPLTARALAHGPGHISESSSTRSRCSTCSAVSRAGFPTTIPSARSTPCPPATPMPELWLLGSGPDSAQIAAYFGLPFSFAHFISQRGGVEIVSAYRRDVPAVALARASRRPRSACRWWSPTPRRRRRASRCRASCGGSRS